MSDKPAYVAKLPRFSGTDVTTVDTAYLNRVRMLQAADKAIKTIIDTLTAGGQYQNTYIIFTSDNGWVSGPHRFKGTKGAPYEEVTRMLLLLRGPSVPSGLKLQHLAGNIDIAPTIAELAGLQVPEDVDGRSLAPLLHADRPAPSSWRQTFLMQFQASSGAPGIPAWIGLRTPTLSYVNYPDTAETELYDHGTDPFELGQRCRCRRSPAVGVACRAHGSAQHLLRCRLPRSGGHAGPNDFRRPSPPTHPPPP